MTSACGSSVVPPISSHIPNRALHLLHVVENLDRGAVDGWAVRMFLASRESHPQFRWSFYCSMGAPGCLAESVRQAGGEVFHAPHGLSNPRALASHLRATIQAGGYDVLHCHHDVMSALYLWAARGVPIQRRIVHVHNADLGLPTSSRLKMLLLHEPMRRSCLLLADRVVGISAHTLKYFTHRPNPKPGRDRVLLYGVDTSRFHISASERAVLRLGLRHELEVAPDTPLLLFTGRMNWFKNPLFVIEMMEAITQSRPDAVAMIAGAGELEGEAKRLVQSKGLGEKVRVLGWRSDVDRLMLGSDLFVFPRFEGRREGVGPEGLGLVVVEAQAAGLPLLMSRGVPPEAVVVPEMCRVLALDLGPQSWAEAALQVLAGPRIEPEAALEGVEASPFALGAGVANLMALYDGVQARGGQRL